MLTGVRHCMYVYRCKYTACKPNKAGCTYCQRYRHLHPRERPGRRFFHGASETPHGIHTVCAQPPSPHHAHEPASFGTRRQPVCMNPRWIDRAHGAHTKHLSPFNPSIVHTIATSTPNLPLQTIHVHAMM